MRDHIVLVVDDDRGNRELLSVVLQDAGFVVDAVDTGEKALEHARRSLPRLVVLDVHLPGISGYEVCRALRDAYGDEIAIIFLSGERTLPLDRVAGLLIGADDYLIKPFLPDELLARVRRLTRRLAPAARMLASKLTRRELDVLRLLALGMSPHEIAGHLFISPKTVATHIEHIFLKLGVNSRAQAVALAYRDDLVSAGHDLAPAIDAPRARRTAGDEGEQPTGTLGPRALAPGTLNATATD